MVLGVCGIYRLFEGGRFPLLKTCLAAVALLVMTVPAHASRVSPMIVDLQPAGSRSVTRIQMTNTGEGDLPVEARMFAATVDEHGAISYEPADDRFLVFPPQTVIPGKTDQIFRVQYLPGAVIKTSQIYYLALRQVPVPMKPDESKVQLVVNFNVLVNVVPDDATPNPVVDWVHPVSRAAPAVETDDPYSANVGGEQQASGAPQPSQAGFEVRIVNRGTAYYPLGHNGFIVSGNTLAGAPYKKEFNAEQSRDLLGVGLVPPGGARIFFIPAAEPLASEGLTVALK